MVYPDTDLSTSERSLVEMTRKATPIKKAAQAVSHKVGMWDSRSGAPENEALRLVRY
jgi:hypothetical protein